MPLPSLSSPKRPRLVTKSKIEKNSKKQKTTANGRVLVHPSKWFKREVADDLWVPESSALQIIGKPGKASSDQARVPESQRLVEPLLTSWFDLVNYSNVPQQTSWRTSRMPAPLPPEEPSEDARTLGKLSEGDKQPVNSMLKLRLYPATSQREKLEHMFASNRAVYNKLIARSKSDCNTRLGLYGKENKDKKMTLAELDKKYRPIAQTKTMSAYFRNKKHVKRHLQVNDEVRGSAFRDFIKAVKSSQALFFLR